ncbi:MAG TPA: EamA family transporter [Thermoleophilaceae bacterium]|nr:EamA family transporter [Thermoleophilaceae bacterium]
MQVEASRASVFDRVPAPGLVIAGIASVQIGAAFATKLFDDLGPAGTVLLRVAFAALILLAISRPRWRSYSASELRLAALFGLTLAFMNLSFYKALDHIHLGIAVTIEFLGPLAVVLAGTRTRLDLLWAVLAAAGVVLLGGVSGANATGVFFAALAGAFWALYILVNARVGRAFSGGDGLAMAMTIGVIPLIPFGIADGGSNLLDPSLLAVGLAVAVLSSVIPYSVEVEALRRLKPSVFGILMSLEPAMAALAGFIVLSQDLSALDVVAMGLVITASIGATRRTQGPEPVD